jgi:hypothetical protein
MSRSSHCHLVIIETSEFEANQASICTVKIYFDMFIPLYLYLLGWSKNFDRYPLIFASSKFRTASSWSIITSTLKGRPQDSRPSSP